MSEVKTGVIYELKDQLTAGMARMAKSTEEFEKLLKQIDGSVESVEKKTSGLGGSIAKIGGGILGAEMIKHGASAMLEFGKGAIMADAQIEKFGVTLQTMLGSKAAADDRLREYMDIAAKTPFEMTQVVEAGNQLQALGKYSKENLIMLGDLAAASGKPIEQAMSAFAKMATGQKGVAVDMFRDLLISADDWTAATGKGIKKTGELMATPVEMMKALPKILAKKGFAGMMDAQSKTIEGKVSNMKDAFFQLQAAIGERMRPAFGSFVMGATGALDKVKKWFEIPLAEKLADEKKQVNLLAMELASSSTPLARRNEIYKELQKIAPEVVRGINAENVSTEQLTKNLNAYNDAAINKIILAKADVKTQNELVKLAEIRARIGDIEFGGRSQITEVQERIRNENKALYDQIDALVMNTKIADEDKFKKVASLLKGTKFDTYFVDLGNGQSVAKNVSDDLLGFTKQIIEQNKVLEKQSPTVNKAQSIRENLAKSLGIPSTQEVGLNVNTDKKTDDKLKALENNIVSGGEKQTNINISLKNLIEQFTINASKSSEIAQSSSQIEDVVAEALLRVLNSANAVAVR